MSTAVSERLLDYIGWQILRELQADGRLSFTELGRRVGLSTPAIIERVRRMEEAGIIRGYRAIVDPALVGLPLAAVIRLRPTPGRFERIAALVSSLPEVLNCDRIAGAEALTMKVAVASATHLEALIDQLMPYGEVSASLVLNEIVTNRALTPGPVIESAADEPPATLPTPMRVVRR